MYRVAQGIGHGGPDPGAIGIGGVKEKDLNLAVGLACNEELVRHTVSTMMSRQKDEADPLAEVIKEVNAFAPDLAVDIHNNAGGGDGFEVYYQTNVFKGRSLELAKNIEAEIVKIGQNSRGCKVKLNAAGTDYFGFLREVKAPAVLVECAFVDNAADLQQIDEAHEQRAFGVAIAKGILKTLGIPYVPPTAQPQQPSGDIAAQLDKLTKERDNAIMEAAAQKRRADLAEAKVTALTAGIIDAKACLNQLI